MHCLMMKLSVLENDAPPQQKAHDHTYISVDRTETDSKYAFIFPTFLVFFFQYFFPCQNTKFFV